jgi:ADP-ribosylglycohydrolase
MTVKLADAVYGEAVGDALGVPFEFLGRGSFTCEDMVGYGSHNKPAGTWSDDTSMTLALCDSIRALGRIDTEDIRRRFCAWYRRGKYTVDGTFDVGSATRRSLELGHGVSGNRDNGNGSLMRTVPLAFTDASDDEIRAVSAITHAHHVSTDACVAMVHIARRLVAGEEKHDAVGKYASLADCEENEIGSSGFVKDTFKASIWCLLTTNSYKDCVLRAVNLGEDTDTTAAVAGALAGILYGRDAIPAEWMDTLRGKKIIESCLF